MWNDGLWGIGIWEDSLWSATPEIIDSNIWNPSLWNNNLWGVGIWKERESLAQGKVVIFADSVSPKITFISTLKPKIIGVGH